MTGRKRHAMVPVGRYSAATLVALLAALVLIGNQGCSANDPFDPESVANRRPTVEFFVGPVVPGDTLRATSYFERSFSWSGTDADGFVSEFYVSIRPDADIPAPWVTTTRTDTVMTFDTGEDGYIEAGFFIACRDDRGALSDTLTEFIPVKNFPPEVGILTDFDPQKNLQREFRDANGEITDDGSAAVDTTYWNWGDLFFDMYASDPDGREAMDDFYRYTLGDDPARTFDHDDPRADPELAWIKVPFDSDAESIEFRVILENLMPGDKTLTVSVQDEALSDTRFQYHWTVRAPAGPVLYIPDASSRGTREFYEDYLTTKFGEGGWDKYVFWKGFPEDPAILLASMRKFESVIWTDSGQASLNIQTASVGGGLLSQYVEPIDGSPAGRLLLISRILTGTKKGLSNPFLQDVMGVSASGSPSPQMWMVPGKQALGLQPHLIPVTSTRESDNAGIGLLLLNNFDNEALYQMEYCEGSGCYGDPRRGQPPYDPLVGMRMPARGDGSINARLVGISLQLDEFNPSEVHSALDVIFTEEFGVAW